MLGNLQPILNLLEGGFARLRILVVGDLMLDRYIWADVERVSPEAPVPVLLHQRRTQAPGGSANVAMNLAGLGVQTMLAGYWGTDEEQASLAGLLHKAKVDTSCVVAAGLTVSKTRILGRNQQLMRLDIENPDPATEEQSSRLMQGAVDAVAQVDAVILSDYAKGTLSAELCQAVIVEGRKRGVPVLVDPKTRDFGKYRGATTVSPNLGELSLATGVPTGELNALLAAGQELVVRYGFEYLIVTMSEKGIRILRKDRVFHSPARAREVFDVSGAGDTVIATIAAGIAGGLDPETAVQLANIAAAIVVGKVGTTPIYQSELLAELTENMTVSGREKILDLDRLLLRASEWRAAGHSVVFTNGCFDLLHVGHVKLLEDCKRMGGKLVVGINADASVRRLKGSARPVVGEQARAILLGAMAAVDVVTIFHEDTPLELIRALRPDVLVKGGDYTEESVVAAKDVRGWGGRVEIVPTVQGFSTTGLVNRLARLGADAGDGSAEAATEAATEATTEATTEAAPEGSLRT